MDMAEESMKTMQNSAGGAMEEMEVIYDSMEYKLNRLSQTGVGIFQNLIDSDAVKLVIDSLTGILTVVDKLTESFGGLGTAGGVAFAALATQNKGWTNYTVVDSYALIGLKRELNEMITNSCYY